MKTKFLLLFAMFMAQLSFSQSPINFCVKNETTCSNYQFRVLYRCGTSGAFSWSNWISIPAGPNQGGCTSDAGEGCNFNSSPNPMQVSKVEVKSTASGTTVQLTAVYPTSGYHATIACSFGGTGVSVDWEANSYARIH